MLKQITEKRICWKSVARKFGFVYLCFDPLRSKQFHTLTAIYTFSWLGDREVTLQTAMKEVPVRSPFLARMFMFTFFCFVVIVVFLFVKTLLTWNIAIPFAMSIHFVSFTYCNICDHLFIINMSNYDPLYTEFYSLYFVLYLVYSVFHLTQVKNDHSIFVWGNKML